MSIIERYKLQVEKLASELNCRMDVDPKFRTSAMMFVESGFVQVPPITDQISYLITLHELGHVYWAHTQARSEKDIGRHRFYFDNGVLHSEAQAWDYAIDHCIDELQDASRVFMWDVCIGSYYQHSIQQAGKPTRLPNGNRHYVEFVYDKPDQYFTSVVKLIQGDLTNFVVQYNG